MPTALLFTRDQVDEVDDWPSRLARIGRSSILWIDLDRPDPAGIAELVETLDLERETQEQLESSDDRPFFGEFGSYLHVTAFAPSGNRNGTELMPG